ncbi:TPA: hypothetical protein ACJX8E_004249 [Pseudomonas aeruginosa]
MGPIRGERRDQGSLFAVSPDELVPGEHPVRVIGACVAQPDAHRLGFSKEQASRIGRPAYDLTDPLKLYLRATCSELQPLASRRRHENGLAVQAYNLKPAIQVFGARRLIERMA